MARVSLSVLLVPPLVLIAGCQSQSQQSPSEEPTSRAPVIVVANYPLEYLVTSLVGSESTVLNPVPPEADPEDWLPDDELAETIQRADLVVVNGASFSDWVRKVSLRRSVVLRTTQSLKDELIRVADFEVHSHGSGGAHSHPGTVAFVWLDPDLMARQADAIAERLLDLAPEDEQAIRAKLQKLKEALEPLGEKLDQVKEQHSGLSLLSRRPLYQYLAKRCGWTIYHTHWKPGQELTEKELHRLNSMQEEHELAAFLWEREPGVEQRKALDDEGLASFVLNPLASRPPEGDYVSAMQRQLTELDEFLTSNVPGPARGSTPPAE